MRTRLILAGLALALAPAWARADSFTPAQHEEIVRVVRDALRTDPSLLRAAIDALQAQDGDQARIAARAAIAANRRALLADPADPVAGNPRGDVTVVEFYDTRCPYCRAMLPVLAALLQAEPGVRLVLKDLPVLGPSSVAQSRVLLAAARQGGYARLQDAVMHGPPQADEAAVLAEARAAGLDADRLATDLRDPAIQGQLQANIRLAHALGIEGTPALVIGDQLVSGATDLPALRQAVAAARRPASGE